MSPFHPAISSLRICASLACKTAHTAHTAHSMSHFDNIAHTVQCSVHTSQVIIPPFLQLKLRYFGSHQPLYGKNGEVTISRSPSVPFPFSTLGNLTANVHQDLKSQKLPHFRKALDISFPMAYPEYLREIFQSETKAFAFG